MALTPQLMGGQLNVGTTTIYTVPANTNSKIVALVGYITAGNSITIEAHIGGFDWFIATLSNSGASSATIPFNSPGMVLTAGTILKASPSVNALTWVLSVIELT